MRDSRTASRKIALCAMLMALAMIFSYVEVLIPINLGVPGIKLGIANLVVVVGLFFLPAGEVLMISVARILLMGYLFGNGMSILYSLARRTPEFSCDVLTETYQRIQYHRRKYCRRRDAQCLRRSAWRLSLYRTANCSIIYRHFS